jgi:hypothetical protein
MTVATVIVPSLAFLSKTGSGSPPGSRRGARCLGRAFVVWRGVTA